LSTRVLITGAGGQLGQDLVAAFGDGDRRGEGRGREIVAADHARLDVGDRDAVMQLIARLRPTVIVHAAAWTAVDACEAEPDRAFLVNALGTRHVGEGARLTGAHVIYLSTDYVFDGRVDRPYREWDDPNPLSVYGRSKLGGERELMALVPGAAIVRTSWVCGIHGANMVKTILRLATERHELAFVDDQRGYPTFTDDLAGMIVRLAAARLPGLFHVTNQGATTWYQLARDVLEAAGRDPAMVRPIATAELDPPRPAPRPANSMLDNGALRMAGLELLPDHHDPLERAVKHLIAL
jgi:dTDP-4-dehydrorhamnose reductase